MELTNERGEYLDGIPEDAIRDCSHSGDCDADVQFWIEHLQVSAPRPLLESYLREFGAWADLKTAEDEVLIRRAFWLACNDLSETGEWFGLVH